MAAQNNVPKPLGTEEFKALLKRQGLKATPQRLAVHEAMLTLEHASADMVALHLGESSEATVTVASVYNILTGLAEAGIYTRRMSSNNKMYFDVNNFRHAHLYDTVNNSYKNIYDEELAALIREKLSKKKFKGFKVDGIEIQILCHPTRRGRKASEKK